MSVVQKGVSEKSVQLSFREISLSCEILKTLILRPLQPSDFEKLASHHHLELGKQDRKLINFLLNDCVKEDEEVMLVAPSVSDLGLGDIANLGAIYQRAQEFGLEICPKQVICDLAFGLEDKINNLTVATKLIYDKKFRFGHLAKIFKSGSQFPVIMENYNINEPIFSCANRQFVFICPRQ